MEKLTIENTKEELVSNVINALSMDGEKETTESEDKEWLLEMLKNYEQSIRVDERGKVDSVYKKALKNAINDAYGKGFGDAKKQIMDMILVQGKDS